MNRAAAVLLAAVVMVVAACGGQTPSAGGPEAALVETVDGCEIDLAELSDDNVLLWFWSPSCQHCRAAIPVVIEAHGEFGDDVRFLGVVAPHDRCDVAQMTNDEGLDGFDHIVDSSYELANTFGVMGYPTYVALGSDGSVDRSVGAPASAGLDANLTQLVTG